VAVDGNVVAEKSLMGFPSEDDIVARVGKAIGSGVGG
jgi:hypothetical protein